MDSRETAATSRVGARRWSERSLEDSLRVGLVSGIAVWQVVMVATVLVASAGSGVQWWLLGGHCALIVVAVLVRRQRLPLGVLFAGLCVMALCDWSVTQSINGALCLATIWMNLFTQVTPAMLTRGREVVIWLAAVLVGVPAGLWLLHPDWLTTLVISAVFTGAAVVWAGRLAARFLRGYARDVDDQTDAGLRGLEAVAVAQANRAAAAEQCRTLHDSVVNTLAVIAAGGAAVRDVDLVRERCALDVRTLDAVLVGEDPPSQMANLDGIAAQFGLRVDRVGLDDDEIDDAVRRFPERMVQGLSGAVREAMLNASKHSGSEAIELSVTGHEGLTVTVRDRGVGFDPDQVTMRGLERSVIARAHSVGIVCEVRSRPGTGTAVVLHCPDRVDEVDRLFDEQTLPMSRTGPVDLVDEEPGVGSSAPVTSSAIIRRACWLWAAAVVTVGVVIEIGNQFGRLTPTYLALAVLAAICAIVSRFESDGRLPVAVVVITVLGVPVVFLLALAGVGFGAGAVYTWQAIAVTPLLVVLMVANVDRVALWLGIAALVVTSAVVTFAVAASESVTIAAVIPVGTAAPLVIVAGWWVFSRTVAELGRTAVEAERVVARSVLERARIDAAGVAAQRWRMAGLVRSRALLNGVADGSLSPNDASTRSACADEEAYVRAVILLEPGLTRMGERFARALAAARAKGVRLVVRTGTSDVGSDDDASTLGDLLDGVVDMMPFGASATASLFAVDGQLRFGVVGPSPLVAAAARSRCHASGWERNVRSVDGLDLVEVLSIAGAQEESHASR